MKNKGFTLIELLGVIIILSIIALIGYFAVGNVINSAKSSSDEVTIIQYAKAIDEAMINNFSDISSTDPLPKEWLSKNVKLENAKVECDKVSYVDDEISLRRCRVNNGEKSYCYNGREVEECSNSSLAVIYGNTVTTGTPSNPGELKSVGDKTKNLASPTYFSSSSTYTGVNIKNNSGVLTFDGTSTGSGAFYIYQGNLAAGTYTISANNYGSSSPSLDNYLVLYVGTTRDSSDIIQRSFNRPLTFTLSETKYVYICFKVYSGVGYKSLEIGNIQLEKGSEATKYEPYGYKISLKFLADDTSSDTKIYDIYLSHPLRKVGDYVDYLDLVNKKVVRNTIETVFNGTESWTKYEDTNTYFINNYFSRRGENIPCISNTYNGQLSGSASSYGSGNIWLQSTSTNPRVYIADDNYTTVEDFKNHLKSNNVVAAFVFLQQTEESVDIPTIPKELAGREYVIDTSVQPSKIDEL